MNIERLKSKIFLAKYSIVKKDAIPYFRELLRQQQLGIDELEQLNWKRTRKLLYYAYEHVPYYQKRFEALGLHPDDIRNQDDYVNVPVLTRADLQKKFSNLVSDEASPSDLRLSTTGGSTGRPVKVYHQKNVVRAAAGWRMLSWWDILPGTDFASIYRDTRTDWKSRVISTLTWWPTQRIDLNAAALTADDIQYFIEQFNKQRPKLLHGYVGAVDYLASYIEDNSISISPPKAIWVTSAPLTLTQRNRIESAFKAPVYDQYGCCEIYWLAAQCPAKSALHMFSDIRKFEFLDDANIPVQDGETGKITITDLENRFFPLIRYQVGDFGRRIKGNCSCGVNLPLMDSVKGRVSDIIKLPNGKRLSGEYMTTIFDHVPDMVKQFQVIQRCDSSIDILVVANEGYDNLSTELEKVAHKLTIEVDDLVPVSIHNTREIPQKGGKLRFIRSELLS